MSLYHFCNYLSTGKTKYLWMPLLGEYWWYVIYLTLCPEWFEQFFKLEFNNSSDNYI